jgi:hypothetical protein
VKSLAKYGFIAGLFIGLYLSHDKKYKRKMSEIAENIQDKVSAASIVKMIDVLLGEVAYNSIVSTQKITDFLLDIRAIATKLDKHD